MDTSDSSDSSSPRPPPPKRVRKASSTHFSRSSMELLKLLVLEQREAQDLRNSLQDMTFQLQDETRRADSAERTARDAAMRFRDTENARQAVQQELDRLKEQLRMYKVQLEAAQREIFKGQELLDAIEGQRHDAEEAAARARTTARKYKEEKIVVVARQEGREEGLREGIERGRAMGYEDGRTEGYQRGWAAAEEHFAKRRVDASVAPRTPTVTSRSRAASLPSGPSPVIHVHPPADEPHVPAPLPELAHIQGPGQVTVNINMAEPTKPPEPLPSPAKMVMREQSPPRHAASPPRSVRSARSAQSLRSVLHPPVDYPPDGWIPVIDNDHRIRLPPPHELAPAPPTPELTPTTTPRNSPPATQRAPSVPLPAETPPLPIPPPRPSSQAVSDSDTSSLRSVTRNVRRPRRRMSDDSQSTTFSQFDLTQGPSTVPTARSVSAAGGRGNVLSSITEEKERSPSVASTMRRPMASPVIPIPGPSGDMHGSSTRFLSPNNIPGLNLSRSPSRESNGREGSIISSVGYHDIQVEPPSRPESWDAGAIGDAGGFLSPSHAERPLPAVPIPSPAPAAPIMSEPTRVHQLPPGFVPSSGSYTGATTAAGVPLPPSTAPTAFDLRPSGPATGTEPRPVIPLPHPPSQSGLYTRAAVQPTVTDSNTSSSSEERDNTSDSSMSSLTTPVRRRPGIPTMFYAAPTTTTGSVSGTGAYASRVPLPPSTVAGGSPRSAATRMTRPGTSGP